MKELKKKTFNTHHNNVHVPFLKDVKFQNMIFLKPRNNTISYIHLNKINLCLEYTKSSLNYTNDLVIDHVVKL